MHEKRVAEPQARCSNLQNVSNIPEQTKNKVNYQRIEQGESEAKRMFKRGVRIH